VTAHAGFPRRAGSARISGRSAGIRRSTLRPAEPSLSSTCGRTSSSPTGRGCTARAPPDPPASPRSWPGRGSRRTRPPRRCRARPAGAPRRASRRSCPPPARRRGRSAAGHGGAIRRDRRRRPLRPDRSSLAFLYCRPVATSSSTKWSGPEVRPGSAGDPSSCSETQRQPLLAFAAVGWSAVAVDGLDGAGEIAIPSGELLDAELEAACNRRRILRTGPPTL
jgi:hypothetical protein